MSEKESTTDAVFNAIVDFKKGHDGCSPTYNWLMEACGISSKAVVFYHIGKLEEEGRIIKGPGKGHLQVVGSVWHYSDGLARVIRACDESRAATPINGGSHD